VTTSDAEPDFGTLLRRPDPGPQHDGSELARPWRRGVALVVDALLLAGLVSALAVVTGRSELLLGLVVGTLLEVGFLATSGATPGRLLVGVRVERVAGGVPTVGVALARHLLVALPLALDGTGAAWAVAGCWVLLDHLWAFVEKDSRSLHDLVVGTVVVRT